MEEKMEETLAETYEGLLEQGFDEKVAHLLVKKAD